MAVTNLDRLARKAEPTVTAEFTAAWKAVQQKHASLPLLTQALAERRSNLVQHGLPWQLVINDLYDAYKAILLRLYETGGKASFDHLFAVRKTVQPPSFTLKSPEAEAWARQYAAALVQGLTEETRQAVAHVITEMIRQGIPPAEGARLLQKMIGLTPRYAQAALSYRNGLVARGFSPEDTAKYADIYAKNLLRSRAKMVARTETLRAAQEGQREAWRQAEAKGYLRPDRTRRQWVTAADERVCPICAPMDGITTGLTEPWETEVGPLMKPTDSHPNCRCAVVLVFKDANGDFPTRAPRSTDTGQPLRPRTLKPV